MEFLSSHLLTFILFFPILAAVVVLCLPKDNLKAIRWTALGASLVPFALTVFLWTQFKAGQPGFQFQEQYTWYAALHSTFHIGVDGLSLTMVLLTTLLTPLALLASFNITDRIKAYFMLFLFLEAGMLGVFMAIDLLIFFVFWEVGLVPMYFLINQWGSEKGEREIWKGIKVQSRNYASLKFIIYTMGGSLGLLLAIQLLGVLFNTFDLQTLYANWAALDPNGAMLHFFNIILTVSTVKTIAFWAFVIAFAIKVPVWPFHTWLPDAHTEAPTAGSMILAGVLLKLGAYGFLRLVLPFYPVESARRGATFILGEREYVVLGDNRPSSADSRTYGPVNRRQIKRRVPLPDDFVCAYVIPYTLPAYGKALIRPLATTVASGRARL